MTKRKPVTQAAKKEYANKSMRFNRFLLFRYMTAIFFFVNLYWALLSLSQWTWAGLVPIALLIVDGLILIEQTQKYWQQSNRLLVTKIGYWLQFGVNLIAIFGILIGQQATLIPFMNQSGRGILLALFSVGMMACLFIQRKAWLIEHDRDKYFTYLTTFETQGGTVNGFRK